MTIGKTTSIAPKTVPRATKFLILLLVVSGCVASAFASDGGVVLLPADGEILDAGTYYRVTWSSPPEAEELELLLFFDGSPTRKVRLTEQLDPNIRSYLWLVPDLPVQSAHIELRWGVDGIEIPGPPGASFEIRSSSRRAALELRWINGEWWLTPESGETELPPAHRSLCREPGAPSPVPAIALAGFEHWFVGSNEVSFDSSDCRSGVRASSAGCWLSSRLPLAIPMRC